MAGVFQREPSARLCRRTRRSGAGVFVALTLALSPGIPATAIAAGSHFDSRAADQAQCCLRANPRQWPVASLDSPRLDLRLDPDSAGKDRAGLARDTGYFMGYQFAAVAVLYAMPESVTGWSEEDKRNYSISKWWGNVSNPTMDSDDWFLNWVTHPYWGAAYFVRARERGYSSSESFWYSALLSTMFEFGAEALAEEPSYQDLVITPVVGSLVGAWFMKVRDDVRLRSDSRGYRSTGDQLIWVLTDPLGAVNGQIDRLFGRDQHAQIRPWIAVDGPVADPYGRPFRGDDDDVFGLRLELTW